MGTESRHARRFVFYAFSLLALVYLHLYVVVREGESFVWSRLVPGEEVLIVIFLSLEVLVGLGFIGSGVRAWCTLQEAWGKATPLAREIHRDGILPAVADRWKIPSLLFTAKLALGGAIIFAIGLALLASGKVDSAEGSTLPLRNAASEMPGAAASVVLSFSTPDNNLNNYLVGVQKIARDLGSAGAKVIVCAMPDTFFPAFRLPIIDTIAQLKNVVMYDGRISGKPRQWSFPVRDAQKERMPVVTTVVPDDMIGGDVLVQWYPYASSNPRTYPTKERETRMDVAVAAVGRFLGLGEDVRPMLRGASLGFGDIRIPVTRSGMAYSRTFYAATSDLVALASKRDDGGIDVHYHHYPGWEQSDDIPAAFASVFAGKIVLLDWVDLDPFGDTYVTHFAPILSMQSNIEGLMHQRTLVAMDWLTVSLIAAIIAMSVFMTRRLRLSWSVVLTLASGIVVFAAGIFALHQYHLLLRTGYALISSIMCAAVFPYIRLIHEHAGKKETS